MAISTAGDRHQSTLICSRAPSSPSRKEVEMKPDPAGFETSMIYRKAGKPEKRGRNIITKYLFQILTKLSLLVCLRNP